jgi:hypothetical protein
LCVCVVSFVVLCRVATVEKIYLKIVISNKRSFFVTSVTTFVTPSMRLVVMTTHHTT